MKSLKLVLFLSLAIVLGSCSSDDDGSNPDRLTEENFFGTYKLTNFEKKETKTTNVDGFDVETSINQTGDTYSMNYEFTDDGNLIKDGVFRIEEIRKQGGKEIDDSWIVKEDREKDASKSNYNLDTDDSKLTMDGKTYDVVKFNSSGFSLRLTDEGDDDNGNPRKLSEKLDFER